MLTIKDLEVRFHGAPALRGVSLNVTEGSMVALIGANGAGKSTVLKTITGLVRPSSGSVELEGRSINSLSPQAIVDMGIALVPEGRKIFTKMTVLENLEMGAYIPRARSQKAQTLERVLSLFEPLSSRLSQPAGMLSGGLQQMVAIGRAMMSCPRVLMLDEPSLGLAPLVVKLMFEVVSSLREQGVTVLLVEQNVRKTLEQADYAYVIQTGEIALHGSGQRLLKDPGVQKAFLGIGAIKQ